MTSSAAGAAAMAPVRLRPAASGPCAPPSPPPRAEWQEGRVRPLLCSALFPCPGASRLSPGLRRWAVVGEQSLREGRVWGREAGPQPFLLPAEVFWVLLRCWGRGHQGQTLLLLQHQMEIDLIYLKCYYSPPWSGSSVGVFPQRPKIAGSVPVGAHTGMHGWVEQEIDVSSPLLSV